MKKLLALSLAALMVMGLATVGFAAAVPTVKSGFATVTGPADAKWAVTDASIVPSTEIAFTTMKTWFDWAVGTTDTYDVSRGTAGGTITTTATGVIYKPVAADVLETAKEGYVTLLVKASDDGSALSDAVTVQLVVGLVNTAPTVVRTTNLAGDARTASPNGSVALRTYNTNIAAWFADAEAAAGVDTLTYAVVNRTGSDTATGTYTLNAATGAFSYTPVSKTAATETFEFKVTDAAGATVTATGKLVITIDAQPEDGKGTLDVVEDTLRAKSKNGVQDISAYGWLENTDNIVQVYKGTAGKSVVAPGKTMYYPLLKKVVNFSDYGTDDIVSVADAVKSISISTKYTLGQGEIESIKVVYKKYNLYDVGSTTSYVSKYGYFLAVTTKSSTRFTAVDFAADVTVKKSSGTDKTDADKSFAFNLKCATAFEIKFNDALSLGELYLVKNAYRIHDLRNIEDEQTFEFDKFSGAYFEVDVTGQDRILLKADAKFNATVAGKYPAANINFFNGYGASFNKIGELHLPAEPGSYLYLVNSDGSLSAVKAEYDDGEECFIVKTRTLGQYAISDRELDVAASVEPSSTVEEPTDAPATTEPAPVDPGKQNPGTGAKA